GCELRVVVVLSTQQFGTESVRTPMGEEKGHALMNGRISRALGILALIVIAAAPTVFAADILGFTEEVSPAEQTNATEPSVAVDKSDGTIYAAWQASGTHVARSDDGGRSFVQTPIADFFGRDMGDVHTRVGGPTPCTLATTTCLPGAHRVYVSLLERLPLILLALLA